MDINGKSDHTIMPHEIQNRSLPFCVAVSVIEGEYFVDFTGGVTVCVKPMQTIFIQTFVKHTVRMENTGKLTYAHFLCNYAMMDIFSLAKIDYFIADEENFINLLNRISVNVYENKIAQRVYTDKILCELFLILFDKKYIDSGKLIIEPWLHNTLQYIHTHVGEAVRVDDLIVESGMSKTMFYRMFKRRMRVSPREYIEAERFRYVSILLLQGKKVKEIAYEIGFYDISYFNKVFKRRYGMTPIEYKQKMSYNEGE